MSSIFCRDTIPSSEPAGLAYSVLPDYSLREWYVLCLAEVLPPSLEKTLNKRFLDQTPTQASLHTPLALPGLHRQGYPPGALSRLSAINFCNEITLEAELIERTLNAPAGAVSEFSRHHLLAVHLIRLRQLWQEFCRRRWPEGWRYVFRRALGVKVH